MCSERAKRLRTAEILDSVLVYIIYLGFRYYSLSRVSARPVQDHWRDAVIVVLEILGVQNMFWIPNVIVDEPGSISF